ncbi:hypothetical protein LTR53_013785 [Teratosphaeriaceae sp. CCFEE 6253]|nr:hypothetical protein LTR53_013785 [Teratosphaeriaceae sp. CCFEE 6253]
MAILGMSLQADQLLSSATTRSSLECLPLSQSTLIQGFGDACSEDLDAFSPVEQALHDVASPPVSKSDRARSPAAPSTASRSGHSDESPLTNDLSFDSTPSNAGIDLHNAASPPLEYTLPLPPSPAPCSAIAKNPVINEDAHLTPRPDVTLQPADQARKIAQLTYWLNGRGQQAGELHAVIIKEQALRKDAEEVAERARRECEDLREEMGEIFAAVAEVEGTANLPVHSDDGACEGPARGCHEYSQAVRQVQRLEVAFAAARQHIREQKQQIRMLTAEVKEVRQMVCEVGAAYELEKDDREAAEAERDELAHERTKICDWAEGVRAENVASVEQFNGMLDANDELRDEHARGLAEIAWLRERCETAEGARDTEPEVLMCGMRNLGPYLSSGLRWWARSSR